MLLCAIHVLSISHAFVLEDNVLHISERGADTLQQQVEGLDRNEFCISLLLEPVFSSRTQRETQVQLQKQKHDKA